LDDLRGLQKDCVEDPGIGQLPTGRRKSPTKATSMKNVLQADVILIFAR
jgi:hypothetical protein